MLTGNKIKDAAECRRLAGYERSYAATHPDLAAAALGRAERYEAMAREFGG